MTYTRPLRVRRAGQHLRIATYNIHKCRGMDARTRPDRILEVIRRLDADIVALQEVVGAGPEEDGQAAYLGAHLGMGWVMSTTRLLRGKSYGNVVLSRFPIEEHVTRDLTYGKQEPRGCQRADIEIGGRVLHVYNVHLGTALLERRQQAPQLAEFVADPGVSGPKVLLGDFNEWIKGLTSRTLDKMLQGVDLSAYLRRRRTYPGMFPVFHLDHIYLSGGLEVEHVELPRTRLTLIASDHLPLVAEVRLPT
jgi:endonuclease/exonuclease/phosphatase family metal-dependent hydrolase